MSFSIRVVDSSGDPISGQAVYVVESALLGGPSQTEYTDSEGWAAFEFYRAVFRGVAHISGEEYEFVAEDGDTLSFSI